jgi:hypothetical protein
MLLLVFTLVEAPDVGWGIRTGRLSRFAAVATIFAAFVMRERSAAAAARSPGVSCARARLVRANLTEMALARRLVRLPVHRHAVHAAAARWSPLETGLAIFPGGLLVAVFSPRIAPLIMLFGVSRLIVTGLVALAAGFALFLPIALDSSYPFAMLPTFLLAGVAFALAFGPLNVAATSGVVTGGAGLGRRAAEHVVPVRRRAGARDRDGRVQRERRRRRRSRGDSRRVPRRALHPAGRGHPRNRCE